MNAQEDDNKHHQRVAAEMRDKGDDLAERIPLQENLGPWGEDGGQRERCQCLESSTHFFRLDNTTFTSGKTNIKGGLLPTLVEIQSAAKVQDETWLKADGTNTTKYDWNDFIRAAHYYGVYGPRFRSRYINVGRDDYIRTHLKQELMVQSESSSSDTVQLNMLHGTHFQASTSDAFPVGKVWGP